MTFVKEIEEIKETDEQSEEELFREAHKPPTDLIFDDGEPMESNRHRIAMNVLIESINHHFRERNDYFAGGNMFIYYSKKQVKNYDFRGPDFFVVLDVEYNPDRQGWVVWDENGRYPDIIVELMSPSTAKIDKTIKKDIYGRTFRTSDYFIFDPFESDSLQGWHLNLDNGYQELQVNEKGWLWSQKLQLWLGIWEGEINNVNTQWLRFYDSNENLVLLPYEAAQKQADIEKQRAETAQQRAETAEQRAETAEQRAETAEQKAARLAAKLRELGQDPDTI